MKKESGHGPRGFTSCTLPSFSQEQEVTRNPVFQTMPAEALRSGVKLIIINRGDTPFDSYTPLRFFKEIGDLLPLAVGLLKQLMGLGDRERTRNPRLVDGEPQ